MRGISAGLTVEGALADPSSRWGGIQRALTTTDFEMANIEYLQFWLMDPFNEDSENLTGGDFYINLGNVSEDVLNDSQLSYENDCRRPTTQTCPRWKAFGGCIRIPRPSTSSTHLTTLREIMNYKTSASMDCLMRGARVLL